jgi:hypothetical protein
VKPLAWWIRALAVAVGFVAGVVWVVAMRTWEPM